MMRRKAKCPLCGAEISNLLYVCKSTVVYTFDGQEYTPSDTEEHDEKFVCPECRKPITILEDEASFLLRHPSLAEKYGWKKVFFMRKLPKEVLSALEAGQLQRLATLLQKYEDDELRQVLILLEIVLTDEEFEQLLHYFQQQEAS